MLKPRVTNYCKTTQDANKPNAQEEKWTEQMDIMRIIKCTKQIPDWIDWREGRAGKSQEAKV